MIARAAVPALAIALALLQVPAPAQSCAKTQVNLTSSGGQPTGNTLDAVISPGGHHVAWLTGSTNVLPGLTNTANDVLVTDLETGVVELASATPGGSDGNDDCNDPSLSSSGRKVAFQSYATNLLPQPQSTIGIYVRDLDAGVTVRADVDAGGGEPDGFCREPHLSPDGRYVAFVSYAEDIVPGVPAGFAQVYLRDLTAGTTELVSVNEAGLASTGVAFTPTVSPGGRFVLFSSTASNLVAADTNGKADVFLRDRLLGTTERVSLDSAGLEGTADSWASDLSSDGRFALFHTVSPFVSGTPVGVYQIYLRDRTLGTTTLVSSGMSGAADDDCGAASLSPGGRLAVFTTRATNLWPANSNGNDDVYLKDLSNGELRMVSLNPDGSVPLASSTCSYGAVLSADTLQLVFMSQAPNLTGTPDPNGNNDVYVETCPLDVPRTYCVAEANSLGCVPAIGSSGVPSASAGSGFVVSSTNTLSQRTGLFFYGLSGPRLVPFQGGLRCVEPPTRRTPLTVSGGNLALDCSGVLSIDFNAWVASGADPALVASQRVWGQWWSRDSGSSFATNLSDAIAFELGP